MKITETKRQLVDSEITTALVFAHRAFIELGNFCFAVVTLVTLSSKRQNLERKFKQNPPP